MTIAARVVLPHVAVPVGRAGLAQRPDEYGRSLHPGPWSDRLGGSTKKATVAVFVKKPRRVLWYKLRIRGHQVSRRDDTGRSPGQQRFGPRRGRNWA